MLSSLCCSCRKPATVRDMPRWTKEKDAQLLGLFQAGTADPTKQDPTYIRTKVWNKHAWINAEHPIKNFYVLYRRKADEWLAEQKKSGSRRRKYYISLVMSSCCLR